jgi:predicted alpha/beta superfamily hydrolase
MAQWHSYTTNRNQHTVVGDLRVTHAFYSPQLDNAREVFVWLPASYAHSDKRYPVLYMHDAQNLFDAYTGYSGEWRMNETRQTLAAGRGTQSISGGLSLDTQAINAWAQVHA